MKQTLKAKYREEMIIYSILSSSNIFEIKPKEHILKTYYIYIYINVKPVDHNESKHDDSGQFIKIKNII